MLDLFRLALIVGYAYVMGRCLFETIRFEHGTAAGRIAAHCGLGLAVVAHAVFFLGLAGHLTRGAVLSAGAVLMTVVLIARVAAVLRIDTGDVVAAVCEPSAASSVRSRTDVLVICVQCACLGIAALSTLIVALAPPTAGDALCYHLEIPKRFVERGAIEYMPLTDNSLFPFHMEMLYSLALLFGSPVLTQLLHWFVGLLLALAVADLATAFVGTTGARWAAVVALLVPGVANQMTAPLNDVAVALFSTLMLSAWVRWQTQFAWRWLVISGVWGGFAIGTKLVAAALVALVALGTLVVRIRCEWLRSEGLALSRARSRCSLLANSGFSAARSLALFSAVVVACGGIWYARSWYYLGNPVYPYFNALFGMEPHTRSLLIISRNPITIPWWATMRPESFGGRGVQFGAVFLAVLPGLALARWQPQFRALGAIAAGFITIWFMVRQELRFLLPIVGILSLGVIFSLQNLHRLSRHAFRAAVVCVACLLCFQSAILVRRAVPCLAVAIGRERNESYLDRREPSYRVARFVNEHLPPGSRLISQDYRGFYFKPDFVREEALRRYCPYEERGDDLIQKLTNWGFTHVLLVQAYNPETAVYESEFADRLGESTEKLALLQACHFEGAGGDRRDYRLYALPDLKHFRSTGN